MLSMPLESECNYCGFLKWLTTMITINVSSTVYVVKNIQL